MYELPGVFCVPCNEGTDHCGQLSPKSPEEVSKRTDGQVSVIIAENSIKLTTTQGS